LSIGKEGRMFPFLRRNTAAEGTGGELVEVENDWVDPAVRAVREVGLDGEFAEAH
jgi:hypothetical protein